MGEESDKKWVGMGELAGGAVAGGSAGVAATYGAATPTGRRMVANLRARISKIQEHFGRQRDEVQALRSYVRLRMSEAEDNYSQGIQRLMDEERLSRDAATGRLRSTLQGLTEVEQEAELCDRTMVQKMSRIEADAKAAITPLETDAFKFTSLLTRPKTVWNHMGWKGKSAAVGGVSAVTLGAALTAGYLINKWRNSGKPDNAERQTHVQYHNYRQLSNQLAEPTINP